ncbi:unnamed protein product [Macrosiphum euphorbiae]|uniref:Uncharacterized protein n=1 Tax=Macrosiphum euphorbiae TaxID=13131 RepID=A0AAV0WFN0_9HEMI|nr:unnamed protein product [Macrosiphum euphorbiae]
MFEKKGKIISKSNEYNDNKKRSCKLNIRLNPLDYGKGPDSQLNHSEKFKVECFLPVIDQMSSALSQRLKAYEVICDRFGFFGQLNNLSNE